MRDQILIVDDMDVNRIMLREILQDTYHIIEAESGGQVLRYLLDAPRLPDLILLDIIMPGPDGYTVLEALKASEATRRIPVLFITVVDSFQNEALGLRSGAADYITKPFHPAVVRARVDAQIRLHHYQTDLERLVQQKTDELLQVHQQVMETLASIIEYRSSESGAHVRRTVELMGALAESVQLGKKHSQDLEKDDFSAIIKAIALHDIGKVGIPDKILLKPGRLTPEEFAVIKTHTLIGDAILRSISASLGGEHPFLQYAREICRSHHERWDGSGYPDGLAGEQIPLSARMAAVVDVYDALVNPRCYKPAYSHQEAVGIITQGRGSQFDPTVVDAMLQVQQTFYDIEQCTADAAPAGRVG